MKKELDRNDSPAVFMTVMKGFSSETEMIELLEIYLSQYNDEMIDPNIKLRIWNKLFLTLNDEYINNDKSLNLDALLMEKLLMIVVESLETEFSRRLLVGLTMHLLILLVSGSLNDSLISEITDDRIIVLLSIGYYLYSTSEISSVVDLLIPDSFVYINSLVNEFQGVTDSNSRFVVN